MTAAAAQQPLVTVVIATYRSRRDHLTAAISSALGQSWPALEIIVSDDSPDDALRTFVDGFRDPRLRYRHNAPPLGVARNHWRAFGESRGEYLAVLNHDDWWAPNFVERLAGALQRQAQAVLAFCDHWVIDASGQRLDAETERNSVAWGRAQLAAGLHLPFVELVARQTVPMAMGALFRRAALPAVLPAAAGPAYDLWLSYLLCRGGGGAWYVPERLSAWRSHDTNLTSQGGLSWLHGSATCWQAMASDPGCAAVRAAARRRASRAYTTCAGRAWAQGRFGDCERYAWRALAHGPTVRSLAACLLPLLPMRLAPRRWARDRSRGADVAGAAR
jgi:hypothetical protein